MFKGILFKSTHDWKIGQKFVAKTQKPVFLAGGLKPENIQSAVMQVKPYGVDLCSGIRTNNILDEKKLSMFVKNLNAPSTQ